MPKIICAKCEVEFRPEENGIHVHELMREGTAIYKIWDADLWKCPGCGILVVSCFGLQPLAEHFQDLRMQVVLAHEEADHVTIVRSREHPKRGAKVEEGEDDD